MGAGRANLRRFGTHHDMSAVPALPDLDLALFEDLLGLHVFQKSPVALLVVLLDLTNGTEFGGQLREALGLGGPGKNPRTYPSTRSSRPPPRPADSLASPEPDRRADT